MRSWATRIPPTCAASSNSPLFLCPILPPTNAWRNMSGKPPISAFPRSNKQDAAARLRAERSECAAKAGFRDDRDLPATDQAQEREGPSSAPERRYSLLYGLSV